MYRSPLPYALSPMQALQALADLRWPVLLESARFHPERGRYSYLAADPVHTWTRRTANYGDERFAELRLALRETAPARRLLDGPPFQGGVIGLLSYELGHCWEQLPRVPADDFTTPPLVAGLYDWCLCWDHLRRETYLLAPVDLARGEGEPSRWRDVLERLERLQSDARQQHFNREVPPASTESSGYPACGRTYEEYIRDVERVVEYIRAGDIYQANLSRKLHYPFPRGPVALYEELRRGNPAPFAAYFQPAAHWAVVSASPEQFLQVDQGRVVTRPIKGTRRRWPAGDLDLLQGVELRASEKDRAENTMIVDLLRNDLSRVCQLGSVAVPRWCELETFEKVHHLVSEVSGLLRPDADLWDLLAATFPGGSITGAPKIRAMEIIAELEGVARGAYCGSLFAAGWGGSLQSSILIRTLTWKNGWVQCPVGGGIVADSNAEDEYRETVHKSAGLIVAPNSEALGAVAGHPSNKGAVSAEAERRKDAGKL